MSDTLYIRMVTAKAINRVKQLWFCDLLRMHQGKFMYRPGAWTGPRSDTPDYVPSYRCDRCGKELF